METKRPAAAATGPRGPLTLSSLPVDALCRICEHLSIHVLLTHITLLSREWQAVARDSIVWSHVCVSPMWRSFNHERLRSLVGSWNQIKTLDAKGCFQLNDDSAAAIADKCELLEHLDLSDCPNVGDDGLLALSRLPRLKTCSLYRVEDITDAGILALVRGPMGKQDQGAPGGPGLGCRQLERLNVLQCRRLTDRALGHLAVHTRQLRALVVQDCQLVTDGGLQVLAAGCTQLTELNARGCVRITDAGLGHLAARCGRLHTLNLFGCTAVSDTGLRRLAAGCKMLQDVNLSNCFRITDEGVKALAMACTRLQNIVMYSCTELTDASVEHLATLCPALRLLDVSRCRNLTDGALEHIVAACERLESLAAFACQSISFEAVEELPQRMGRLKPGALRLRVGATKPDNRGEN